MVRCRSVRLSGAAVFCVPVRSSLMAPNVVVAASIIKHVFEACRDSRPFDQRRKNLSVPCSIVSQQFDHMFY
jgi:hypothetical protein